MAARGWHISGHPIIILEQNLTFCFEREVEVQVARVYKKAFLDLENNNDLKHIQRLILCLI